VVIHVISGLRSAELLILRGFNVTILEARDRIGGRVSNGFLLVDSFLIVHWLHQSSNLGPSVDL
jgi:monoamine oxidase